MFYVNRKCQQLSIKTIITKKIKGVMMNLRTFHDSNAFRDSNAFVILYTPVKESVYIIVLWTSSDNTMLGL